jgi:hypothetical protein
MHIQARKLKGIARGCSVFNSPYLQKKTCRVGHDSDHTLKPPYTLPTQELD